MARRGLRKQQGRKSLRPRAAQSVRPTLRPSSAPAAHTPQSAPPHVTDSAPAPRSSSPTGSFPPRLVSLSELTSSPTQRSSDPAHTLHTLAPTSESPAQRATVGAHEHRLHTGHARLAHDEELDDLSTAFFSERSSAHRHEAWEDDHPLPVMSQGSRRAMIVALSIFGVSLVSILLYTGYHHFVMPAPVELGAAVGAELPVPIAAPPAAAVQHAGANTVLQVELAAGARPATPEKGANTALPIASAVPSEAAPKQASPALAQSAERVKREAVGHELAPAYDDLLSAGQTLSRRGQRKAALEAYHRALSIKPTGAAALSRIAYLHLNAGDSRLAREYALRAVEADPKNSEGWIVLGAALEGLGDRAAALLAYRKCTAQATGAYALECQRLAR